MHASAAVGSAPSGVAGRSGASAAFVASSAVVASSVSGGVRGRVARGVRRRCEHGARAAARERDDEQRRTACSAGGATRSVMVARAHGRRYRPLRACLPSRDGARARPRPRARAIGPWDHEERDGRFDRATIAPTPGAYFERGCARVGGRSPEEGHRCTPPHSRLAMTDAVNPSLPRNRVACTWWRIRSPTASARAYRTVYAEPTSAAVQRRGGAWTRRLFDEQVCCRGRRSRARRRVRVNECEPFSTREARATP